MGRFATGLVTVSELSHAAVAELCLKFARMISQLVRVIGVEEGYLSRPIGRYGGAIQEHFLVVAAVGG